MVNIKITIAKSLVFKLFTHIYFNKYRVHSLFSLPVFGSNSRKTRGVDDSQ